MRCTLLVAIRPQLNNTAAQTARKLATAHPEH